MKVINKTIKSQIFEDVLFGVKTFEIIKEDDIKCEVGDILILKEIDENSILTYGYTYFAITYVLRDYEGIEKGYAIVGIEPVIEKERIEMLQPIIDKALKGLGGDLAIYEED